MIKKRSSIILNPRNEMRMERSHTLINIKSACNSIVDDVALRYPSFSRLRFEVNFKADKSIIEISADGILKLYKSGKVNKF